MRLNRYSPENVNHITSLLHHANVLRVVIVKPPAYLITFRCNFMRDSNMDNNTHDRKYYVRVHLLSIACPRVIKSLA